MKKHKKINWERGTIPAELVQLALDYAGGRNCKKELRCLLLKLDEPRLAKHFSRISCQAGNHCAAIKKILCRASRNDVLPSDTFARLPTCCAYEPASVVINSYREAYRCLEEFGVTTINLEYDGAGDNGSCESYALFDSEEAIQSALVSVVDSCIFSIGEAFGVRSDSFTWQRFFSLVTDNVVPPGYENNEGGYGTVEIDLATGQISIDHYHRYIETFEENYVREL